MVSGREEGYPCTRARRNYWLGNQTAEGKLAVETIRELSVCELGQSLGNTIEDLNIRERAQALGSAIKDIDVRAHVDSVGKAATSRLDVRGLGDFLGGENICFNPNAEGQELPAKVQAYLGAQLNRGASNT